MTSDAIAESPAAESAESAISATRWIILLALVMAAMMELLDTTIINVSLPQMAGNLGATLQEISWVSTAYILANVVVLPMTAFFTATFGRRVYLTASIVLFVFASFMCGTSQTLFEVVIWRIAQGVGGAALLSTAQATVAQIFPKEQQGIVQAVFLLGIIVAPTLGPTLGGWITDNYTWHWCFFINIPIGIAAAFLVSTFLHDPPGEQRRRVPVDWPGITLLTVGLGTLQYVLEEGQRNDWFSDAMITRLAILSGACLATLVWWELSAWNEHPIIEFRILKNRELTGAILLFVALGFGLYAGGFIFPLFVQTILGFSATESGLTLLPGGIAAAVATMICGRLLNGEKPLVDPRVLIYTGIAIFVVAMWQLGHLGIEAGEPDARYPLIIRGVALGFLFTPINQIAFGNLKPGTAQQASGLINLSRQLGGSFGIAAITTYLGRHIEYHRADLVTNLYATNPALVARQHMMVGGLIAHGMPAMVAQQTWLAELDGIITRQAAMLSYNDCWMVILMSFVVVSPVIIFLRRPKGRADAAMMH